MPRFFANTPSPNYWSIYQHECGLDVLRFLGKRITGDPSRLGYWREPWRCGTSRRTRTMTGLLQDFRYALRQLRKNLGFTAVAVLTLALGIGVTTAIFSVVYGVLLRPLPYRDSNRIMAVFEVTSKDRPSPVADPNFDDFRDQSRSFQAIAKYSDDIASVSGASQPTRTTVARVSSDFLKVFAIQPILGRDFSASDAKKGAGPTVLVSYGYWRQHLGWPRDLSQ